ncbi:hypothetical protein KFL_004710040 [Klebsormidium nitens]|uniref:Uncharacterized protein n=1 Tax=Klebsormidium nitens TaxID=105231 RepID=A0A1Y1ID99_KLENI|nr:hypothetical protein KFL_004710040 [Klebsormidium nitens]|eukprot:GAQ88935.1 hypothetical protein KFL_004710040 [Klebsormidium nitens]
MASKSAPPEGTAAEKETVIPMPTKVSLGAQAKKHEGLIDYSMVDGTNLFAPANPDSPLLAPLKGLKKAGLIPQGTYIYDANHPIRLLFRLTGTAAKMALLSSSFWLIISVHVLLLICYYQTDHNKIRIDTTPGNTPWPFLRSSTYAGFLGTLVSFVLVFQTTQSYARFFVQYDACNLVAKAAWQFTTDLRTRFDDDRFPGASIVRQKLLNYCIACCYLGFAWLPHYKKNDLHVWALKRVHDRQLLTLEEEALILALPEGVKPVFSVVKWTMYLIFQEFRAGHITERTHDTLAGAFLRLFNGFSTLYEYAATPVPFAFHHLLNVMAIGYLLILAYTQVFSSGYWSIFPMLLTVLCTLGIRELSNALADPFGCDETDIPVLDSVLIWDWFFTDCAMGHIEKFKYSVESA